MWRLHVWDINSDPVECSGATVMSTDPCKLHVFCFANIFFLHYNDITCLLIRLFRIKKVFDVLIYHELNDAWMKYLKTENSKYLTAKITDIYLFKHIFGGLYSNCYVSIGYGLVSTRHQANTSSNGNVFMINNWFDEYMKIFGHETQLKIIFQTWSTFCSRVFKWKLTKVYSDVNVNYKITIFWTGDTFMHHWTSLVSSLVYLMAYSLCSA